MEDVMAVVLIADIPDLTSDMYRQALNQVRDQLKTAPGFVAHAGTPTANGFRVTEIWESREDCTRFLESTIMPLAQQVGLPPFQPELLEADEAFTR
jgi:heme-degrading monooxygenase HmoA